ncbi:DUF756 domain-containing protein [Streptomyces sp. LHD-70]|uniref:phospholipase domain-containing protein n=1 Tax=Streptomyces sp. LHD-70 TaxID=3072140 RepID=UPI00280D46BA|nr:phospholipase domain-containing protein [Streptomyces sp. LHD-70]MDQ8703890.1 DUF756 domain-containing protein [Streptomyces sp. LHD-70]
MIGTRDDHPNDFGSMPRTQLVGPHEKAVLTWPTESGRYDVTVTTDGDMAFAQRYAGTVHAPMS